MESRIKTITSPAKSPKVRLDSVVISETDRLSGDDTDIAITLIGPDVGGEWKVVRYIESGGQVVLCLRKAATP